MPEASKVGLSFERAEVAGEAPAANDRRSPALDLFVIAGPFSPFRLQAPAASPI